MITCSLSIHNLCEQELLECVAMSKHIPLSQTRSVGGHIVPSCHSHLVQRLTMCTLKVLHHYIAVDKVRSYPRRVETGSVVIQEHHTHYIISNVPLFVDLRIELISIFSC